MVPADDSPWAFPLIRPTDTAAQWFAGQAAPRPETVVHRYEFDPREATLDLIGKDDEPTELSSSGDGLSPGVWVLGVRLRSDYQLVAFVPAVKVVISETGDASYQVYQGELGVRPTPGPVGTSIGRF